MSQLVLHSWQQATLSVMHCLAGFDLVVCVQVACLSAYLLSDLGASSKQNRLSDFHCAQTIPVGTVQPTPPCFLLHRTFGPDGVNIRVDQ